ncbi:4Fe-4S dicluster domain-containing protein [Humisphaera borealis]|uniref:4Fe-4S binding protein n=1 Tax=Humisphaera borealis TaxID=2807512 RepID=A0A7M2WSC3_9BACT|nr:4Fe-4S dicluster domain-containing protein [Humisphaera borealis]QOV88407.1 4Fe-4S binding protein [Humisphaera borealis]
MSAETPLIKANGRVLSTMEEDGSRRWLCPRLAPGRFWFGRRLVAYVLIAIYAFVPFVTINGKPAVLLDLTHRRFTFFGFTFLPTDTILLALSAVVAILLVFLTTALLGRIWCGWACPQTVYLEFVFRPIERLFMGRQGVGGKPRAGLARWRFVGMYATFFVLSLHLANTFLAYFVGASTLHSWILGSPLHHPAGFVIVAAVTGLMMFNFGFFREQTCLIACPYGRLQSVLLDRSSLIISYDVTRGEPRGKKKRGLVAGDEMGRLPAGKLSLPVVSTALQSRTPVSTPPHNGDCIDCGLCVAVCPTGIDIRDGLQFECVGCAQCIDVCDDVMTKIQRPKGLIRYGSQAGMAGERVRLIRPRVIIYPLIILAIGTLLGFLLLTRSPVDVVVLRGPGQPFLVLADDQIANVLRVKLTNRTDESQRLVMTVVGAEGIRGVASQAVVELPPQQTWTESVEVFAPQSIFTGKGSTDVTVRVTSVTGAAVQVDRAFKLLGPMSRPVPAATQQGVLP